jgi:hypothetical protein
MLSKLLQMKNKNVLVNGVITGKLSFVGTLDIKVGNEWVMRNQIKSIELV